LRDAAGDVLLSDGNPLYAGRELSSRIVDFVDPATPDRFHFQPGHKRSTQIRHSSIDGGIPVPCEFTFIVFTSSTTPNWYQTLSTGGSTPTDARFICHADSVGSTQRRFTVDYPEGASECATIIRTLTAWEFTAPPTCLATITSSVKERGKTTSTVQPAASAPMQITAVVP
jgi:hypothetical protein